jgi:hypothetical protein
VLCGQRLDSTQISPSTLICYVTWQGAPGARRTCAFRGWSKRELVAMGIARRRAVAAPSSSPVSSSARGSWPVADWRRLRGARRPSERPWKRRAASRARAASLVLGAPSLVPQSHSRAPAMPSGARARVKEERSGGREEDRGPEKLVSERRGQYRWEAGERRRQYHSVGAHGTRVGGSYAHRCRHLLLSFGARSRITASVACRPRWLGEQLVGDRHPSRATA